MGNNTTNEFWNRVVLICGIVFWSYVFFQIEKHVRLYFNFEPSYIQVVLFTSFCIFVAYLFGLRRIVKNKIYAFLLPALALLLCMLIAVVRTVFMHGFGIGG